MVEPGYSINSGLSSRKGRFLKDSLLFETVHVRCCSSSDPVADDAALADALANDEPAVDLGEDESVLSSFGRGHAGDV